MASTVNPSGGLILAAMTVAPEWSRPDDAERQARLDAMKRRATGLLAVALLIFVGASLFEAQFPWLGYVRATAEASLVGGLADWFAVTALFRYPLGLPIPHTAIVATRKERIGQILGNFVQNHFLSRDVISANLRRVHPAERGAQWLADREHARQIARQSASGFAPRRRGGCRRCSTTRSIRKSSKQWNVCCATWSWTRNIHCAPRSTTRSAISS